jgi:hypothetical protein
MKSRMQFADGAGEASLEAEKTLNSGVAQAVLPVA